MKKAFRHLDLFADVKFSLLKGIESFEIVQKFFTLIPLMCIKCQKLLFRTHTGFSQSVLRYIKTNIYMDFGEVVISITSVRKRDLSAWKSSVFFQGLDLSTYSSSRFIKQIRSGICSSVWKNTENNLLWRPGCPTSI